MTRVVVFAYHHVGVRCLKTLLHLGVDIPLVITHKDNPNEEIWFDSVAQLAKEHHIEVITPDDPNTPEVIEKISETHADFIFSFYYRQMLKLPLLLLPKKGAFNMHGSYLPFYRGRVPINWAIINGESETGVTLHQMNIKPDNGPIVDQMRVPILLDDNAQDVFMKVTVAAELVLLRSFPKLCHGTATLTEQDLTQGRYFGGRKPEDGLIDKKMNALQMHNMVRALSHPYPGAFFNIIMNGETKRLYLWKTRLVRTEPKTMLEKPHFIYKKQENRLFINASGGGQLELLEMSIDDQRDIRPMFNNGYLTIDIQ